MGTVLELAGVDKSYGRHRVLDDFSLRVDRGECIALVGENGAGKTTALEICAGVQPPDAGTITRTGSIGYCPQQPGVVELLSADDHLVLFGAAAGLNRQAALERGRSLLDAFGFPVGDETVARDLSGGTRQKLNLALALLGEPLVLLLDEPYQGFDHGSYVDFWRHVDVWRDDGRAVVVVTHLLTERRRVDRVVELGTGQRHTVTTVTEVPA